MERTQLRKMLMYSLVSGLTGLVYMGLLFVMDRWAGFNPFISVTVAYAAAMAVYFVINRHVIFANTGNGSAGRQLFQFGMVVTANYFLTQLIVQAMYALTHEVYSGSLIAGIVTISVSYFIFDRVIFKPK